MQKDMDEPKQYKAEELASGLAGIKLQVNYNTPTKKPAEPSFAQTSPGLSTPAQATSYVHSPTAPLKKSSTPITTPLDDAATSLLESYQQSTWASSCLSAVCNLQDKDKASATGMVNGMAMAGLPPDLYTAALRAVLVEWAAMPGASLSSRLQAADALCTIFGMHKDLHEQLLYRALSANEQVVPELFKQAQALVHNRFGIARTDFVSKAAYQAWRRAALAETLAALAALQQLPEFNALLEVTLVGACDLSLIRGRGGGFWCCGAPDAKRISPYTCAWLEESKGGYSSRVTSSPDSFSGKGQGMHSSNPDSHSGLSPQQQQQQATKQKQHPMAWMPPVPEQHTQVALDSGPDPSWHARLQDLPLTTEALELKLKIKNCQDHRGIHLSSRDKLLGRNSIRIKGLRPGVAQYLTIPLFARAPSKKGASQSKGADGEEEDAADLDSQVHMGSSTGRGGRDKIVYDPETDTMHGMAGIPARGKLTVKLRYIVERRPRSPSPALISMACAASSDEEDQAVPAQANRRTSPFSSHLNQAFNDAADEAQGSGRSIGSKSLNKRSTEREENGTHPVGQIMSKLGQGGENLLRRVNPLSLLSGFEQGTRDNLQMTERNMEDYMHHLFVSLATDSQDNPLTSSAAKASFLNSFKHAAVSLVAEPPPHPPPPFVHSPSELNMHQFVKQLAAALSITHKSWDLPSRSLHPQVRPMELMPLPANTSKQQRQAALQMQQLQAAQAVAAAGLDGSGALPLASLPLLDVEAVDGSPGASAATAVLVGVLADPAIHVHLPFGQGLSVLLRFGRLYRIRSETLLLLLVQHMLEQWPLLDRNAVGVDPSATSPPSHASYCKPEPSTPDRAAQQQQLQQQLGGWAEYLNALRQCWEPLFSWYAAGTLTSDEVEGFKGCMGLFLCRAVPVLFHHYSIFKRQEGVVCFMTLLEMVGWACTWDPEKETPVLLLHDYIDGAATSRMIKSLHPTENTLPAAIMQVAQEVRHATEDLQRDLDIQGALPGLSGFALTNCRKRYKMVAAHLETLFKFHPGTNGQAMQAMQQLESALTRHHHQLLTNGLAVSLNPVHTEHVLEQHYQHLFRQQQQQQGGKAPKPMPPLGEKGAAQRKKRMGGEPFKLWDFEAEFTKALDQWVVTGALELAAQVQRLIDGEEWRPLGSRQKVAGSAVELQRLLNASLDKWLDAALGGGPRRRRIVGRTITACLAAVLAKYTTCFAAAWDMELERRSSFFICTDAPTPIQGLSHTRGNFVSVADLLREKEGGLEGLSRFGSQPAQQARAMLSSIQLVPPPLNPNAHLLEAQANSQGITQPLASSPGRTPPQHGRSQSMAQGSMQNLPSMHRPNSSFSVRPRMNNMAVRSMSIGHRDGPLPSASNDCMGSAFGPTPSVTPPHGSRASSMQGAPAHNRNRSMATKDAGGARDMIAAALAAEPGICLTETMCVVRATLQQFMDDTHDLAKVLHAALVTSPPPYGGCSMESAPEWESSTTGTPSQTLTTHQPMDDIIQHPPQHRAALSALLSSAHTLDVSFGAPQREGVRTLGMAGCRMIGSLQSQRENFEGGVRTLKGSTSAASCTGELGGSNDGRLRQDFVVATWCDVERAQMRVVSHLISSYTVQVRSCILNMLIAACGRKATDEPSIKILAGVLTALHDELKVMREGLGGCAPIAGEMAGAVWRAALSALQLLVLHQVGFRELGDQEADVSRQMLISLYDMFAEEIPTLADKVSSSGRPQPCLDLTRVPNPAYFWELMEQIYLASDAGNGTFTSVAGAATSARVKNYGAAQGMHHRRSQTMGHAPSGAPNGDLGLQRLMSEELPTPHAMLPALPPDPAIGRLLSSAYCSALLQAVTAATEDLQDMYSAQLSCIQEARPGKDAPAFVALGPQQLSLLDVLRLLRQRRRTDPAANNFATEQLKAAAAVPTQIIFGLSSHQRLVAEAKCYVAGIRLLGRLGLTQEVLCFTTLLDSDLKSATDTTFTVLLAKVNQCCRGNEPNSLLLTTVDHEQYVFLGFPPGECDRMLMNIRKDTMIAGPPPGSLLGALPPTPSPAPHHPVGTLSRLSNSVHQRAASYSGLLNGGGMDLSMRPGPLQQQQQQQQQGSSPASAAANVVRNVLNNYYSPQARALGSNPGASTVGINSQQGSATPNLGSSPQLLQGEEVHTGLPPRTPTRHAPQPSNDSVIEHPSPSGSTMGGSSPQQSMQMRENGETTNHPGNSQSAQQDWPPPAPGREHLSPPVMVAPCHLTGRVFDTDGTLLLFRDRIDFVASREGSPPGVAEGGLLLHTIPLSDIQTVTQKSSFLVGNPLLVIQLEPNPNSSSMPTQLTFGGITDALLASFKQCISDLATSS